MSLYYSILDRPAQPRQGMGGKTNAAQPEGERKEGELDIVSNIDDGIKGITKTFKGAVAPPISWEGVKRRASMAVRL